VENGGAGDLEMGRSDTKVKLPHGRPVLKEVIEARGGFLKDKRQN